MSKDSRKAKVPRPQADDFQVNCRLTKELDPGGEEMLWSQNQA